MKAWGYGEGYQHAHAFEDAVNEMQCLPDALAGKRWYHPTERGIEKRIKDRLDELQIPPQSSAAENRKHKAAATAAI